MTETISKIPRIIKTYELFEERLVEDFIDDDLTDAACMATAVYYFDPPEDEIELYATFVLYRVEQWYGEDIW